MDPQNMSPVLPGSTWIYRGKMIFVVDSFITDDEWVVTAVTKDNESLVISTNIDKWLEDAQYVEF